MFRRFPFLLALALLLAPPALRAHPGHDSAIDKLRPDAKVLRGEGAHFRVEVKYNPFPLSRRADLVFFPTFRNGQKPKEPALQGTIFPSDDAATSSTVFFRRELHYPEVLFAKPLLTRPVPHTLRLVVNADGLSEEILVKGVEGEGTNNAVAVASGAAPVAAPTEPALVPEKPAAEGQLRSRSTMLAALAAVCLLLGAVLRFARRR